MLSFSLPLLSHIGHYYSVVPFCFPSQISLAYRNLFIFERLMKDFPDSEEAFSIIAKRPVDQLKAKASKGIELSGIYQF